jgi:hypothetical protein
MRIVEVDEDVGRVAQYMEETTQGQKLYHVAKALSQLAELLWTRHVNPREEFHAFRLRDKA